MTDEPKIIIKNLENAALPPKNALPLFAKTHQDDLPLSAEPPSNAIPFSAVKSASTSVKITTDTVKPK